MSEPTKNGNGSGVWKMIGIAVVSSALGGIGSAQIAAARGDAEMISEPVTWGVVITAAGIVIAWLTNKLWRAHRHEVANLKETDGRLLELVEGLMKEVKAQITEDRARLEARDSQERTRHEEMLAQIGALAVAVAELRGRAAV